MKHLDMTRAAFIAARDWMGSLKLASAGDRSYSYDAALQLSDGAVAMIASGFAQNGGTDGIIDLGGNQGVTPVQQARMDAALVVNVTALDTVTGDESYELWVLGSNAAGFTAGTVAVLGGMVIGGIAGKTTIGALNTVLDTTGMYEILFTNEQDNIKYQYIKLYLVIAGTTPSITLNAFVAEIPRI